MTPVSRFVISMAMACLPLLASAEGKCDDDPKPYGPANKLVVTWAIPYPKGAVVKFAGEEVFNQVDQQLGLPWFHPSYPSQYKNPKMLDFFNDADFATTAELKAWEKAILDVDMPAATEAEFANYVNQNHNVRGALVEHPPVPSGYSLCTCVLQRGVAIYWGDGQQDLYVRSHFSSTNPTSKASENFAPRGGYWFSFKRANKKVWFPVRLNRLLKEKAWMVLDILTPQGKPLKAAAIPAPYTVAKQARVRVLNQDFEAIRLLATFDPATFDPAKPLADLEIAPP